MGFLIRSFSRSVSPSSTPLDSPAFSLLAFLTEPFIFTSSLVSIVFSFYPLFSSIPCPKQATLVDVSHCGKVRLRTLVAYPVGYKVHLTETCDDDLPHVITHVETTHAPLADLAALPRLHEALGQRDLLPERHLVDTGYVDAEALLKSQHDDGVDLFGPTRDDTRWQAREGTGFAASHFVVNWERKCAVCPAGKTRSSWSPVQDRRGHPVVKIKFAVQDCGPCPHRQVCTQAETSSPRRTLTVRPLECYQALQAARQRQALPEFTTQYNQGAGIEGTLLHTFRGCIGMSTPNAEEV